SSCADRLRADPGIPRPFGAWSDRTMRAILLSLRAMSAPPAPAPPRRAAIAFIFATVVIDVLALGIVIPVLPKLIERFEGGNTALAAETFGLFGTAWGLMQFLCMPVMGALSDRFGRRPVVLISCFGLGCDYFLMALAPNLTWLFVGRVISGIT